MNCGVGGICQSGSCGCLTAGATFCQETSGILGNGGTCTWTDTDPGNCDACGTHCADGGACSAGSCSASLVTLASSNLDPIGPMGVAGGLVFWQNDGELDGGLVERNVMAAPSDGGASIVFAPNAVLVGIAGGLVYWNGAWGDAGHALLESLPDGGSPRFVAAVDYLNSPVQSGQLESVAVDSQSVYWTECVPDGLGTYNAYVKSTPIDGGPAAILAQSGGDQFPDFDSVAVDQSSVYWAVNEPATGGGAVYAMAKDGGSPTTLAPQQNYPSGLVVTNGTLYWADQGTASNSTSGYHPGALLGLSGGQPATLWVAPMNGMPTSLSADSSALYFWTYRSATDTTGAIVALAFDAGSPVGLAIDQDAMATASDGTSLYWISNDSGGTIGSTGTIEKLTPK